MGGHTMMDGIYIFNEFPSGGNNRHFNLDNVLCRAGSKDKVKKCTL